MKVYTASRASVPERSAMWRSFRDTGAAITSSWIDEAGEGETECFTELWDRIAREIAAADALVLYAEPDDFPLKGALIEVGIAVDRYPKVEDNLQAIHHIIEARRTEMRHGGLHIVRQTFKGFTALPAPAGQKSWRQILKLTAADLSAKDVDEAYRRQAATLHPDKPGGDHDRMSELNRARAEAKAALSV